MSIERRPYVEAAAKQWNLIVSDRLARQNASKADQDAKAQRDARIQAAAATVRMSHEHYVTEGNRDSYDVIPNPPSSHTNISGF